jgi:hypothetical protein
MKGDPELDPKGLITEAFRMEGISTEECRSIFLDWALSLPDTTDTRAAIETHLSAVADESKDHPMAEILRQGLTRLDQTGRRGGRRARTGLS